MIEVNLRRGHRRGACLTRWCREYLAAILPDPRSADYELARDAALYAAHLASTPPPQARLSLEAGLGREFARWEEMFGPAARP